MHESFIPFVQKIKVAKNIKRVFSIKVREHWSSCNVYRVYGYTMKPESYLEQSLLRTECAMHNRRVNK